MGTIALVQCGIVFLSAAALPQSPPATPSENEIQADEMRFYADHILI